MNHPLIIGAGGVASYLLPVLLKTFKPAKLTIIDRDVLEERNLDRQMFRIHQIGQSKASALLDLHADEPAEAPTNSAWRVIEDWFTEATTIPDGVDAIICCADNHEARNAALTRSDELGIGAYIGGNEYFDSQAYVYFPRWKNTKKDPRIRYPLITTSHEGSPIRCQGDAQIASPQLAIANLSCASKLLRLLWIYEVWLYNDGRSLTPEQIEMLPYELNSSIWE